MPPGIYIYFKNITDKEQIKLHVSVNFRTIGSKDIDIARFM